MLPPDHYYVYQNTCSYALNRLFNKDKSEISDLRQLIKSDIDTITITRGVYADIIGIKREYSIQTPKINEVITYLSQHPDVINVLWKASKFTSLGFNGRGEISLEVRTGDDPLDQILTLIVRMYNYPDDIIDQLDTVCEKFESELIGMDGFLLLTTDFQPPKNI